MRQLILVEERSDPGENGAVFPPVQVKKELCKYSLQLFFFND